MKVTLGKRKGFDCLDQLAAIYESLGVEVIRIQSETDDEVFHRDVFAWTPYGLIKCNMKNNARKHEPDRWFDQMGLDPALEITTKGTFEGADLLWVNSCRNELAALLALGQRTDAMGALQVKDFLESGGTVVAKQILPIDHDQHLLGVLNYVGSTCFVNRSRMACPHEVLVPENEYKGVNFVVVGESVVMVDGCPQTKKSIEHHTDYKVITVEVSQLLQHQGGIACATGILEP